jgi:hydroxymethylpyrimidine kinase/phosphomethylpyrimidine kinase
MASSNPFPIALTIAGFDPSGEAGVLADAKTFAAFGFRATAVVTSLTFQNRAQVFGAVHQSGEVVRSQLIPLLNDYQIVCSKVGMLPTREVVLEVARLFKETALPSPVVDPVMISSSGHRLMEVDALEALISELLPLARLITPNVPEAEQITGMRISSEAEMLQAAAIIRGMGARAVLIKGGHLPGVQASCLLSAPTDDRERMSAHAAEAIDVLDNEGEVTTFREHRIPNAELHGSGCILSAAIAAGLGKGLKLEDSVRTAKKFVWKAIREARTDFS